MTTFPSTLFRARQAKLPPNPNGYSFKILDVFPVSRSAYRLLSLVNDFEKSGTMPRELIDASSGCLKITLDDGEVQIPAFEITKINGLDMFTPQGTQILVKSGIIRNGMLVLNGQDVQVIHKPIVDLIQQVTKLKQKLCTLLNITHIPIKSAPSNQPDRITLEQLEKFSSVDDVESLHSEIDEMFLNQVETAILAHTISQTSSLADTPKDSHLPSPNVTSTCTHSSSSDFKKITQPTLKEAPRMPHFENNQNFPIYQTKIKQEPIIIEDDTTDDECVNAFVSKSSGLTKCYSVAQLKSLDASLLSPRLQVHATVVAHERMRMDRAYGFLLPVTIADDTGTIQVYIGNEAMQDLLGMTLSDLEEFKTTPDGRNLILMASNKLSVFLNQFSGLIDIDSTQRVNQWRDLENCIIITGFNKENSS